MQVELAQLSSEDRSMMYLRYVDDVSQQDIAARLGVSQMHVSRTLRRVGALLRERALESDLSVAS